MQSNGQIPGSARLSKTGDHSIGIGVTIAQQPEAHMDSPLPFDLGFLDLIPAEEF